MGKLDEQIARTARRGGGVLVTGLREFRAMVRDMARPEMQALGIDHIDPFTSAGQRALSQARDAAMMEGNSRRHDELNAFVGRWTRHQRQMFPDAKPVPAMSNRWEGAHPNDPEESRLSRFDIASGEWAADTTVPDDYYQGGPEEDF